MASTASCSATGNRVGFATLEFTVFVQTDVDLLHEGMEVHAAFALDRRVFEKQIHDHRLATADPAVEVQTLGRNVAAALQAETLFPAHRAAARFIIL